MSPFGDEGIRTPDPLLAGQVLSQLSYTPVFWLAARLSFPMNPDGSLKIEQQLVLLTPIRGTRVIPRPFSLERR